MHPEEKDEMIYPTNEFYVEWREDEESHFAVSPTTMPEDSWAVIAVEFYFEGSGDISVWTFADFNHNSAGWVALYNMEDELLGV